jgi:hypothetical protein
VVPETASCEMASVRRVKAPLQGGRGGVLHSTKNLHLGHLTGYYPARL